jgi:hypothetical protein
MTCLFQEGLLRRTVKYRMADYGEAAGPDPIEETVEQPAAGAGFSWVIVLVIAGIVVIGGGLTAFVVLRKKGVNCLANRTR